MGPHGLQLDGPWQLASGRLWAADFVAGLKPGNEAMADIGHHCYCRHWALVPLLTHHNLAGELSYFLLKDLNLWGLFGIHSLIEGKYERNEKNQIDNFLHGK
jgi:hypothetical protein